MSSRTDVPLSPYKGLAAFDDSDLDALFFFGRARDTEVISANLLASRFTVLHGPLGVGKSSILRAGVARRLRLLAPDTVVVVHNTWSGDPKRDISSAVAKTARLAVPDRDAVLADGLAELAARLGGDLYLVLDQFEELFAYPDAGAFANELAEVVTRRDLRVNVLLAMREDALSELDVFTGRIPNVFGNRLALARLDRPAARTAITGPIARYNELSGERPFEIQDELVDAVLDEIEVGRVVLADAASRFAGIEDGTGVEAPYLQLVMERLWETEHASGSHVLRHGTLEQLGGAQAIVGAHLDEALHGLAPREQDVAARVFNHLVTPSGTKIAHDVPSLAEYAHVSDEDLRAVLASLAGNRILRPVNGRFEIFHDVLAAAVLDWRVRYEGERALELQRAESERRHRKLLLLLGSALVSLAAMAAVTVYALAQRAHAREQAGLARAEALSAKANRLASEAGTLVPIVPVRVDPELGLLLGAEAAKLVPTPRTADVLRRALLVSHLRAVLPDRRVTSASFGLKGNRIIVGTAGGSVRVYSGDVRKPATSFRIGGPLLTSVLSPDGRLALTTQTDGAARIWDAQTGTMLRSLGRAATAASFSSDGSLVLTVQPGGARVWEIGGSQVSVLRSPDEIRQAAFGPGGTLVVTVGDGHTARVFEARSGRLVAKVDHGGDITSAAIMPDGDGLVTTGKNRTARIWELRRGGRLVHELTGHRGQVTGGVVSADGGLLVTTSTDATARVWTLPSGRLVTDLIGHTNQVIGASFDSAGASVVTWSLDGTARVWDPRGGATKAVLTGPGVAVTGASFDSTGDLVLTRSADGRARLWRSHVDAELRRLRGVATPVTAATFSEDGNVAAVASRAEVYILSTADGRRIALLPVTRARVIAVSPRGSFVAAAAENDVSIWRLPTGEQVGSIHEDQRVTALAQSGDAGRLAIGTADGTIRIATAEGRRLATFAGSASRVTTLAFGRSGDHLAAGFGNGFVASWSLRKEGALYQRLEHRRKTAVLSVAFSADGSRLVSAGRDSTVHVLNAGTGRTSYILRGHAGAVSDAAFSPNGQWIVTAGPSVAGLWDLAGRQRLLFLSGHGGRVLAATLSENGRDLKTVGSDGTLRTYRCEVCSGIPELLRLAELRLEATGRRLTANERRMYLDAD